MTVGIHQPNFLPWLGYFYKIYKSDLFVILDNVQFIRRSICNSNKIKLGPNQEFWLTVPVKGDKGAHVNYNELGIDYSQQWVKKLLKQITAAYQKTPFYHSYFPDLEKLFKQEYETLADLNLQFIYYYCKKLGINTPMEISSKVPGDLGKKSDLMLNLCKHFNADVYLSGHGAKKYNDEAAFEEAGIKIIYSDFNHPVYPQPFGEFMPNLSVIDLFFNCGEKSSDIFLGSQS